MPKFDQAEENRLQEAIRYMERNPGLKTSNVAKQFKVSNLKLWRRMRGTRPISANGGHNQALTCAEDEALKQYLDFLISIGHQAGKKHIFLGANSVLRAAGKARRVDAQWAKRWFQRNREWYKTIRGRTLAVERRECHTPEDVVHHFEDFQEACSKWGIQPSNLYNMDETGFRVG